MKSIKIIATPQGQAPIEVREKWVGVIIPLLTQDTEGIEVGVLGGQPENTGGYKVNPREAVDHLERTSPEAAAWWNENVPVDQAIAFVFARHVCELVEE